jgi:hypothetical protein
MNPKTIDQKFAFAIILVLLALLIGCSTIQPTPTPLPPTLTPIQPTPTVCFWTRNPGPAPEEVVTRAQEAFSASGMVGTLWLEANGEYYCSEYHVQDVGFEFHLQVNDLKDEAAMRELVARAQTLAADSVQGWNLGTIRILFQSDTEECWWDELQDSCDAPRPRS